MGRLWPELPHSELELFPPLSLHQLRLTGSMLLGGACLFGLAYLTARLLGGIAVGWRGLEPSQLASFLFLTTVATALNATWEEYTFRGVVFSACVRAFGPHGVVLVLGSIFGLAHLFNPNWSWLALLSISAAGWLICYTMLRARSISAPIGIHVGWNLTLWLYRRRPLSRRGAVG